MVQEPVCEECGNPLSSALHLRGVGLHGHITHSEEVTAAGRAQIAESMGAFTAEQYGDMDRNTLNTVARAKGVRYVGVSLNALVKALIEADAEPAEKVEPAAEGIAI